MHRIRRQILELDLPHERGAAQLAQRAADLFQAKVLPLLDEVFSRMAPDQRIMRLQRLEIQLPTLPETGFDGAFVEACLRQITAGLEELAAEAAADPEAVVWFTEDEKIMEVAYCYLQYGFMPWYAHAWSVAALAEKVAALVARAPAAMAAKLSPIFNNSRQPGLRLVAQFPPDVAAALLEAVYSAPAGRLETWLVTAVADLQPANAPAHLRTPESLQRRLLQALLETGALAAFLLETQPARQWIWLNQHCPHLWQNEALAPWLPSAAAPGLETPAAASPIGLPQMPLSATSPVEANEDATRAGHAADAARRPAQSQDNTTVRHAESPSEIQPGAQIRPPTDSAIQPEPVQGHNPTPTDEVPTTAHRPSAAAPASTPHPGIPWPLRREESLMVASAGLVLLAPYLPPFFSNLELGLADAPPERRWQAACLLHYLAAGPSTHEEPALLMPKLLAGLPWDEPMPADIALSNEAQAEGEALLRAVIQNWPALKNTSPDGLRSAFLQRPGLLSWSEGRDGWLLRVERQSLDFLLDQLPWGFSVIKHPWMEKMLVVEW